MVLKPSVQNCRGVLSLNFSSTMRSSLCPHFDHGRLLLILESVRSNCGICTDTIQHAVEVFLKEVLPGNLLLIIYEMSDIHMHCTVLSPEHPSALI